MSKVNSFLLHFISTNLHTITNIKILQYFGNCTYVCICVSFSLTKLERDRNMTWTRVNKLYKTFVYVPDTGKKKYFEFSVFFSFFFLINRFVNRSIFFFFGLFVSINRKQKTINTYLSTFFYRYK